MKIAEKKVCFVERCQDDVAVSRRCSWYFLLNVSTVLPGFIPVHRGVLTMR